MVMFDTIWKNSHRRCIKKYEKKNNKRYLWMTRDHAVFAYVDPMFKTKLIRYSSFRTLAQTHVATSCDSGGIQVMEATLKSRKVAEISDLLSLAMWHIVKLVIISSFYLHCPPYSIISHVVRQSLHWARSEMTNRLDVPPSVLQS